ncbi:ABC transporter substrate-binding protein [Novosphingobium beihaiensis]|uniref:ABC transporter substrate-binding protein n=1 Tax=Novosphingobium beihaiensis TaxID=2930389 RepID=A0ABT0BUP4_9SPHN|nr:ABC transporter substrate-binding protein [Novosphingobium beihaiensis]MCJ2188769.1 ABC transporter substrate-binding protein [Novosphingobium beihaiensis]
MLIAPVLGMLLASCSQAPLPGVSGRTGAEAGGGQPSIVSLNPCTDAILAEVTVPGQLLAISHYSQDPASSSMDPGLARRFQATSGAVEEVAALAPDVVVAGSFLPPATQQALRDLGMRVVTFPIPANVPAAEQQVRDLAALAGNAPAGNALVQRIETALAQSAPPAGAAPLPALMWESGGIVAGNDTLIADLLGRSGFSNGVAARGLSQADYLPLERVLANPPKVIFAVGNARSNQDHMLYHPALDALKGTARVPFDNGLLWCGGPTIPRALARLTHVRRAVAGS